MTPYAYGQNIRPAGDCSLATRFGLIRTAGPRGELARVRSKYSAVGRLLFDNPISTYPGGRREWRFGSHGGVGGASARSKWSGFHRRRTPRAAALESVAPGSRRPASRGAVVVVAEHAAQALPAADGAALVADFLSRLNELVVEPLMVAFGMVVATELAECPAQRCLAEKDQSVDALGTDPDHRQELQAQGSCGRYEPRSERGRTREARFGPTRKRRIQNRPNPRTGSAEELHEHDWQITRKSQPDWPVLTRKGVAGFNPQTDTRRESRRLPVGASPTRRRVAPAGSHRSDGGGNKPVEASGVTDRLCRSSEQGGRNVRERRKASSLTAVDLSTRWVKSWPTNSRLFRKSLASRGPTHSSSRTSPIVLQPGAIGSL